jgi:hypothetical protein
MTLVQLPVGTARCAVRAAYQRRNVGREACGPGNSFRPLNAGGDIAARCPYHPGSEVYACG